MKIEQNSISAINSCTVRGGIFCCFELLKESEKELLENSIVQVKYNKGEIICKQGAFASHIIYIREGLAKIYIESNQNSLVLKIVSSESLIGLPSVMEGNTIFQYSAMAYQDSIIDLVDMEIFRKILKQNAKFAYEIINVMSENALQIIGRFYCLTNKQSYGRFADILCCLSERVYKSTKFKLSVSRKDLSELTGLSIESVSRIIKEFKNDKLIHIAGKEIEVLDIEALRKISETG